MVVIGDHEFEELVEGLDELDLVFVLEVAVLEEDFFDEDVAVEFFELVLVLVVEVEDFGERAHEVDLDVLGGDFDHVEDLAEAHFEDFDFFEELAVFEFGGVAVFWDFLARLEEFLDEFGVAGVVDAFKDLFVVLGAFFVVEILLLDALEDEEVDLEDLVVGEGGDDAFAVEEFAVVELEGRGVGSEEVVRASGVV